MTVFLVAVSIHRIPGGTISFVIPGILLIESDGQGHFLHLHLGWLVFEWKLSQPFNSTNGMIKITRDANRRHFFEYA